MIPVFTDGFFSVDADHGFLPLNPPLETLPSDPYESLQLLLDSLPSFLQGGLEPFRNAVLGLQEYPVFHETHPPLIAALYRAYCFVASAYLLHPAHLHFVDTHTYGIARDSLPRNIAQPLLVLADKLHVSPWLEYSFGYSLGNYVQKDPSKGLNYENLRMACSFTGTQDETGFIMVHVDINQHSPLLLRECNHLLNDFTQNRNPEDSLASIHKVLIDMNRSRKKMWEASRWEKYNDFRVFIMGSEGNSQIFPRGVIYEPETEPRFYRGQSGSQDTVIPFLDILFRISDHYPENELTGYLIDMRKYRPKPFRDLLQWVDSETRGLVDWILTFENASMILCKIYQEIYDFRNGHWHFVQKYIMANTKYPVATGGTPIISWLPNQIHATLAAMKKVLDMFPTGLLERHQAYQRMVIDLQTQQTMITTLFVDS